MTIGRAVTRQAVDNEATELAAAWEALAARTHLFHAKVSADLGAAGLAVLPGGGYSDHAGTGQDPAGPETEAQWMERVGNYFGNLVGVYEGTATQPDPFNYSDALKPVRGLGR